MSKYENGNRDVYFLMDQYKKATKGENCTDICVLFSFWQSNYGEKDLRTGEKEMSKDFQNLLTAIKTARKHVMRRQRKKDSRRHKISLKSDLKSNSKDASDIAAE